MPRSKAESQVRRLPLLVFAVALLAGVVIFVSVHRGPGGAHRRDRSAVSGPNAGASAPKRAAR